MTDDFVLRLALLARQRQQIVSAELRLGNQIAALERWATGKLKGKRSIVMTPEQMARGRAVAEAVNPFLEPARKQFRRQRAALEKEMAAVAMTLPIWSFVKDVRGVGALGLALVLAETGDLSGYSGPSKVWMRLGLGVIDGKRQQRIAGTTPGKTAEAIRHGFCPRRRALAFVMSDAMLKQNRGVYRRVYDERKTLELAKLPADAKGVKAWAHRRALRYMMRRFVLHLWCSWNGKVLNEAQAA